MERTPGARVALAMPRRTPPAPTLFTIGHSNRTFEDFLRLLKAHGIKQVLDVRAIPKSRRNPQFERSALRARGIGYRWMPKLGGRRRPQLDSPNAGWRNAQFRGYADYMAKPEFVEALQTAEAIGESKPTTLMCAEAVPWRCHRTLISDALATRKWKVRHITGLGATRLHRPTPFMRLRRGEIIYPQ
jgi:uncharacterized protein (DUF488 family)